MTSNKHPPRPLVAFGPDWEGEEAFIIGGGTSVQPDAVNLLRERPGAHVIVLNSAYRAFPWAEMLFFADERWIREELATRPETFKAYSGEVISIIENTKYDSFTKRCIRTTEPGLTSEPTHVRLHFTAARGAANIALHKRVRRLIFVGLDNRDGEGGRVHFHEGYPPTWTRSKNTWTAKRAEMESTVAPLKAAGIEVVNASPISTLEFFGPRVDLATWLKENPPC